MSARGGRHPARWRRWANLPALLALLFATSVVGATAGVPSAAGAGHAPLAVQVVGAAGQQAAGQPPEARFEARGGSSAVVPSPSVPAWLAARTGGGIATWWHRRQDAGGHRVRARLEIQQGRGPPGRRAVDVPS